MQNSSPEASTLEFVITPKNFKVIQFVETTVLNKLRDLGLPKEHISVDKQKTDAGIHRYDVRLSGIRSEQHPEILALFEDLGYQVQSQQEVV